MASRPAGVATLERVEAILRNPAIYKLANLIPRPVRSAGGRRRTYPDYMLLVYDALLSVYGSARQVEAELAHPLVWRFMQAIVSELFPHDPKMQLPDASMQRHHYIYGRDRYLTEQSVLEALGELHRQLSAGQARELGLLDPTGPGSWTHPHPSRILHGDGKVLTPLFRAKPGDIRVVQDTGEVLERRHEPDAALHFEGDGEAAWGTKFVLVACRTQDQQGRIILDVDWVSNPGGEAQVAMTCFTRLSRLIPGAQGIVYDTALRGVHHQRVLRDLGLIPINKVTAAEKGSRKPRRAAGRRREKSTHIEDKPVRLRDGSVRICRLFARGGAIGIVELTDSGEPVFTELRRVRTHRIRDKSGSFRWYNDHALPESYGCGIVTVRLHGTEEDAARRLNRTENVRPIPPTDPDFRALYGRRNDSESINRGLEDSLWLRRAHSVGHARQHVELLGYALMVNGLALLRHRRGSTLPRAA